MKVNFQNADLSAGRGEKVNIMYSVFDYDKIGDNEIFTNNNYRECLFFVKGYIQGAESKCNLIIKDENGKIKFKQGFPPKEY